MEEVLKLRFKRLSDKFNDIQLPGYATKGSSGMDIRAAIDSDTLLPSGKILLIPTNLSVEIPGGFELQVRPRSGIAAKHGISILNAPGTIDSDYRGEIKIILINLSDKEFVIHRGDRIAQLVLSKVFSAEIIETNKLKRSKRGKGGFGHSGKD
jgi:dUTP pyrophosphatase